MFGLGILEWLKLGAAALVGAVLIYAPVYYYGKANGRQQAAVDALETSVQTLKKRNEIDDEVSASDAASLCRDFGLSDDEQAECVRRVREADAKPGNVGLHPRE